METTQTHSHPRLGDTRGRPAAVAALVCAALASLFVLTVTAFDQRRVGANGTVVVVHHLSVWDLKGAWGLGTLLLPVVVAAFAVVALADRRPSHRVVIVATVALWVWTLLLVRTIGVFYVPAALLATVAARRSSARIVVE
jgi:hypothetical protein